MSNLSESENYIWSTSSVLGTGATSNVYRGLSKINGEAVAVKKPHRSMSGPVGLSFLMKEIHILRKLKHENIVRLLACEDEIGESCKVIVMEFCSGGSLHSILDDPENAYGLEEDEFLLVLQHLTHGVAYLRTNNLIHRDIKPGNIMRFFCRDGSTVYKLIDFGTAKHLGENEKFASLYGTKEYLHPKIFETAILKTSQNEFKGTVDLWSIGVTLYHIATGSLPFCPSGGSQSNLVFFKMISEKEPSAVAAAQMTKNGPIKWFDHLPETCLLSESLKILITPLIAGLLESSDAKAWSFDTFFTKVEEILSKKCVHVHEAIGMRCYRVYLDQENHLKNTITKDLLDNVTFIFNNKLLTDISTIPETTRFEPLIVFGDAAPQVDVNAFVEFPQFGVPDESERKIAKNFCKVAHDLKRRVDSLCLLGKLTLAGVLSIESSISKRISKLYKSALDLLETIGYVKVMIQVIEKNRKVINSIFGLSDSGIAMELEFLLQEFNEINFSVCNLYEKYVNEKYLLKEWESNRLGECPWAGKVPQRVDSFVCDIRTCMYNLFSNVGTENLCEKEKMLSAIDQLKIERSGIDILKNLNIVANSLEQLVAPLKKFSSNANVAFSDYVLFENKIKNLKHKVRLCVANVEKSENDLGSLLQDRNVGKIKIDLGILINAHKEIFMLVEKNKDLVNQLNDVINKNQCDNE